MPGSICWPSILGRSPTIAARRVPPAWVCDALVGALAAGATGVATAGEAAEMGASGLAAFGALVGVEVDGVGGELRPPHAANTRLPLPATNRLNAERRLTE